MSGTSTLDPDNFPSAPDRVLGRGHGTEALGPSDTSDSGSDIQGGSGLAQQIEENNLDGGTNEDLDEGTAGGTAGPDVGDADLDSDTDAGGTGERATVGRDTTAPDGADINVDLIESVPLTGERDTDDIERGA
jgi:hypothetical protein